MGFVQDVVGVDFLPPVERHLPPRPGLGHVHVLGQQEPVRHGLKRRAAGWPERGQEATERCNNIVKLRNGEEYCQGQRRRRTLSKAKNKRVRPQTLSSEEQESKARAAHAEKREGEREGRSRSTVEGKQAPLHGTRDLNRDQQLKRHKRSTNASLRRSGILHTYDIHTPFEHAGYVEGSGVKLRT